MSFFLFCALGRDIGVGMLGWGVGTEPVLRYFFAFFPSFLLFVVFFSGGGASGVRSAKCFFGVIAMVRARPKEEKLTEEKKRKKKQKAELKSTW